MAAGARLAAGVAVTQVEMAKVGLAMKAAVASEATALVLAALLALLLCVLGMFLSEHGACGAVGQV